MLSLTNVFKVKRAFKISNGNILDQEVNKINVSQRKMPPPLHFTKKLIYEIKYNAHKSNPIKT